MAMTSVSHRAQILPVATPATAAVRPARRFVQVAAKQEVQQKFAARTGIAAAAAAALLVASPVFAQTAGPQLIANLAEQGIGGIKPEARDETRGLPLSDSRYPAGSTIAGDETKIREARKQKDEDILNDKAKGGDYTTTGTLLDPYGKEPSKYPTKSS
ncbi:hypothetical protein WJX79_002033 [Trebouxia sp. C0005]|nr:MAG: hypothetical protein FRX49_06895 [Trebouxia sp. A1-2]